MRSHRLEALICLLLTPTLSAALLPSACLGSRGRTCGTQLARATVLLRPPADDQGPAASGATPRGDAGRTSGRGRASSRARGRGRARGTQSASAPVKVRYITELEMQSSVQASAIAEGFDEAQASMLSSCARNIYSMGCQYHPNTVTLLQELCASKSAKGEPWAELLKRCISGQMPRLRSSETASVRMKAAAAAAARRRVAK
jgi:hypothetical protein